MIVVENLSKSYGDCVAVNNVSITIKDGSVFGLIGSNGAGKSTFMRMLAGILKNDSGTIMIDDLSVFENPEAKQKFFYISDEQFYFPNAMPGDMMGFYEKIYPEFDRERCMSLLEKFDLPLKRKISTYSKGMKKQLSIIFGLSSKAKYLFCDETFDGLDPVMRQGTKSLFAAEMLERNFTPVIASHNLRELEDICDHVGLLHKGGVILSKDIESVKSELHKFQLVLANADVEQVFEGIEVLLVERRGSLITVTARGDGDEIMRRINGYAPLFAEKLPLSLEEIFISETGVKGYDIKNIIF